MTLDSGNPVALRCKNFAAINRYVAVSTLEQDNEAKYFSRIAVYDVHAKTVVRSINNDVNEGTEMGHRFLSIGYATEQKYYGAFGLKVLYSMKKPNSEKLSLNQAFIYRDLDTVMKQIDVYSEGDGEENTLANKMVQFTAQGNHLVYKNAQGW